MKKYLSSLFLGVLIVFLVGLGFLGFSPDYNIYTGRGKSMAPTLNHGDWVITKPLPEEIRPGMILAYEDNQELIIHRAISVDGQNLITKGDSFEEADPWPVLTSDIRGVYFFKIPYLGYLSVSPKTPFGEIPLGALLIIILIGWLIIYEIKEDQGTFRRRLRNPVKGGVRR